jgi:hypothetical protein
MCVYGSSKIASNPGISEIADIVDCAGDCRIGKRLVLGDLLFDLLVMDCLAGDCVALGDFLDILDCPAGERLALGDRFASLRIVNVCGTREILCIIYKFTFLNRIVLS